MKTIKLMSYVLIAFTFIAVSCSSEDGEDGMDGLQGEQGEQGSAGEDGSKILTGSGEPDASIGVMGDYYINQDTRELYGPKIDDTTWGSPISLGGSDGAPGTPGSNGADGSQILSGTSAPTTSLGQDGDYYLRANTYDLYGPKTSGAWGSPINLKGSTDVMYTGWFNFVDGYPARTDYFFPYPRTYSFLNDNYIDNGGSVLVYMGWVGTSGLGANPVHPDEITNLPKFDTNGATDWEVSHRLNTGVASGSVELTIRVGSTTATSRNDFLQNYFYVNNRFFRIIFIPGGTALKASKEGVDFNDYEAVKKYYGIKD